MKSIYRILSVLLFGSLIISCTPTETPTETPAETSGSIVGNWELVALNYTGTTTTTVAGENLTSTFEGVGKNIKATVTYTENPNKAKATGSYTVGLKTTTMGTTTNVDVPVNFTNEGTWTRDGLMLTTVVSGKATKSTIIELTATTLKLKSEEETVHNIGGGVTSISKTTSNLQFKKK